MAYQQGEDLAAREDMALCSLFGGLALANGGLGAVHGFAGPIGGMFEAPHGAICASLLPYVMKHNVDALSQQGEGAEINARYAEIARILIGDPQAEIQDGVAWLQQLSKQLGIPGLRTLGIDSSDFDKIISNAKVSSSMQKKPLKLSDSALRVILEEAY
jgi:alcohol dehydrogenase class IV